MAAPSKKFTCQNSRLLRNNNSLLVRLIPLVVIACFSLFFLLLLYKITLSKSNLKEGPWCQCHLLTFVGLQTNCCVQMKCAASASACSLSFTRRPRWCTHAQDDWSHSQGQYLNKTTSHHTDATLGLESCGIVNGSSATWFGSKTWFPPLPQQSDRTCLYSRTPSLTLSLSRSPFHSLLLFLSLTPEFLLISARLCARDVTTDPHSLPSGPSQ